MNSSLPPSVVRPVSPAIERMKRMLFRPFDFSKWVAIGFCSWLAGLGGSSGGNFNFNNSQKLLPGDFSHGWSRLQHYLVENLAWVIPVGIVVLLLILGLVVLLLWLGSRGAFMFLHCVVRDRGEVAAPWREYLREGNSLLRFRLILVGCGLILILFFVALFVFLALGGFGWVIAAGQTPKFSPRLLTALLIGVAAFVIAWVPLMLAMLFTKEFVVPIMFLRRCSCTEAWGEFLTLLRDHPWSFLLYLLFQIVIAIVVGLIVIAVIIGTCCLAGIVMVIPVAGSVLLLPISVFCRNYSLIYLAQFGPEYDLLREDPPVLPMAN